MKIFLNSEIFNNAKLMSAIEKEFGGITQDCPTFAESDDEFGPKVWSNNESHEAVSYVQSINRFLEGLAG